jgi:23S rRNA pseudouridine2605 synthase
VRNVLEHLGLQVNRLIRVSFGPFQLAEMREGSVEEVRTRTLRDQLGERIAALSGADFAGLISPSIPPLQGRIAERSEAGWGQRGKSEASPTRPAPPATLPLRGRDKKVRPPQDDGAKTEPKRISRSDTIADRRGRPIPVTRTRTEKPERPAPHQRGGKARRPDRSRGPRPSRPR